MDNTMPKTYTTGAAIEIEGMTLDEIWDIAHMETVEFEGESYVPVLSYREEGIWAPPILALYEYDISEDFDVMCMESTGTRVIDASAFRVSQEPDAFLGRLKAAQASVRAIREALSDHDDIMVVAGYGFYIIQLVGGSHALAPMDVRKVLEVLA